MKTLENRTIYECEHCGRKLLTKAAATLHEKACSHNPNIATICKSCQNLEKRTYTNEVPVQHPSYGGSGVYMQAVTEFTCKKTGKKLYSPKVLRMRFAKREEILSQCDEMMPTEAQGCSMFRTYEIII